MPDIIPEKPKPKVLILSFSPLARDPRVLRQIDLVKEFAEVVTCGFGPAPREEIKHIEVPARFEGAPWRSDRKALAALLMAKRHHQLYFGSEKIRYLLPHLRSIKADVILANDALALPLAVALKPPAGVHADLHEFAPRQGDDNWRWRLTVAPFMNWACRSYLPKAYSATTVSEGIALEYAQTYGVRKPDVVYNAGPLWKDMPVKAAASPIRLVHIGIAGRVRQLETMIDAVVQANKVKPGAFTLDMILAPGESLYIEELAARADAHEGNSVKIKPPVAFDDIVPTLNKYDVGIYLCPPTNFNMANALPNKLFEFVQARLAVVIGPSPEMRRVVEEYGFGFVSADFTAEAASKLLAGLSVTDVQDAREKAAIAALSLNHERVSEPWVSAVKRLVGQAAGVEASE